MERTLMDRDTLVAKLRSIMSLALIQRVSVITFGHGAPNIDDLIAGFEASLTVIERSNWRIPLSRLIKVIVEVSKSLELEESKEAKWAIEELRLFMGKEPSPGSLGETLLNSGARNGMMLSLGNPGHSSWTRRQSYGNPKASPWDPKCATPEFLRSSYQQRPTQQTYTNVASRQVRSSWWSTAMKPTPINDPIPFIQPAPSVPFIPSIPSVSPAPSAPSEPPPSTPIKQSAPSNVSIERDPIPQSFPEDIECKICMEAEKNAILLPCGHYVLCWDCASLIKGTDAVCPMCRAKVDAINKVF